MTAGAARILQLTLAVMPRTDHTLRRLSFCLCLVAILAAHLPADLAPAARAQQYRAAFVYEPVTGTVLYSQNGDRAYPTASMVKMMTLLTVADHVARGDLSWDDEVVVSARASLVGGSQVYLKEGETFTLHELAMATLIHSGNDAAYLLAETAGDGSVDAFVADMNRLADRLELTNSRFYTPHGLPPEKPGQHDDVMSPRDLAVVGAEILAHPVLSELVQTSTAPFRDGEFQLYNSNHLLREWDEAIGIKTGWTSTADFCLTAAARRGETTLLAVVVGAERKRDSFDGARELLEKYLDRYELVRLVEAGERLERPAAVLDGAEQAVPVVAADGAALLVRRGTEPPVEAVVVSHLPKAPVERGELVGEVVFRNVQSGALVARVGAIAARGTGAPSWWQRLWRRIVD